MSSNKFTLDETLKIIGVNKQYFDRCLNTAEKLVTLNKYSLAANYLDKLAKFNWTNTTGYYTNWTFEKLLCRIGGSLAENKGLEKRDNGQKLRILHVASDIPDTGGHTRLLMNWIKRDADNIHNVVITRQDGNQLPEIIIKEFELDKSLFHMLDSKYSFLQKANELREKSYSYDIIITHCHPDDIIPTIAFSCKNVPPVAIMNVADNQFWVGASICDLLIQFRESYINLDRERKSIQNQYLLHLPLTDTSVTSKEKYLSERNKLGIHDDEIMLLTAGIEYKYEPNFEYNFFETVIKVLDENKNTRLFIAGIPKTSSLALRYPHERIEYLGTVTDLYRYEEACDIYLDGFPHMGATAMLETGIKGKCVHLIYNPYEQVIVFPENVSFFKYYNTEEEWVQELNKLISDSTYRNELQRKQLEYLQYNYSLSTWKSKIKTLYEILLSTKHSVYENDISRSYANRDQYYLFYIGFGKMSTNHFLYCCHLPILTKIKHATYLFNRPPGVRVGKRSLLKFIFS